MEVLHDAHVSAWRVWKLLCGLRWNVHEVVAWNCNV